MRSTLAVAAGFAFSVLAVNAASAATFQGTYTVSPFHNNDSGGVNIGISNIAPLNFSTSPTVITNLFRITIDEAINASPDDTTSNPIGVNFTFTLPGSESGSLSGSTLGTIGVNRIFFPDTVGSLSVTWNSPIVLNFDSGEVLTIALANLTISCTSNNVTCDPNGSGGSRGGNVSATFTYTEAAPVATPLPAALPLLLSGCAGLVMVARRRKGKARAAL